METIAITSAMTILWTLRFASSTEQFQHSSNGHALHHQRLDGSFGVTTAPSSTLASSTTALPTSFHLTS
jgi:hypothetical protein